MSRERRNDDRRNDDRRNDKITEERRNDDRGDDRENKTGDNSLRNLVDYLEKNGFSISEKFHKDGICEYIKIYSEDDGEEFFISTGKDNIQCTDGKKIVKFSCKENCINYKSEDTNPYSEIDLEKLQDEYLDPSDVDKMMDQYSAIDLNDEKLRILGENIRKDKMQLERLKLCTSNIKFKLCIESESSLCVLSRSNYVKCFSFSGLNPSIEQVRNLFIVVDLETFIDIGDKNSKNIINDIKKVYKKLFSILDKAHSKQTFEISSRIKTLQIIHKPLIENYKRKIHYEDSIEKLSSLLIKIKKGEKDLSSKIKTIKKQIDTSTVLEGEKSVFSLKKYEEDLERLLKFKQETLDLLLEIKEESNNFILNFDHSLFDTIKQLSDISQNMRRIGVLKCKK